jgi:hypothetical protein
MAGTRASHEAVSEVSVDPQPNGLKAVYLVETRSEYEAEAIKGLFAEVAERVQVRKLCDGKLMSYVVQAEQPDGDLLDELDEILRRECEFVVTQRSFDEMIHRIVRELAGDTGSKFIEMPRCNICGKAEPFPSTIANLTDGEGDILESRCYCQSCTAEAVAPSNKEFLLSLLEADEDDFEELKDVDLLRRRSGERSLRFRVKR